jgi:hypothetical protein
MVTARGERRLERTHGDDEKYGSRIRIVLSGKSIAASDRLGADRHTRRCSGMAAPPSARSTPVLTA